MRDGSVVVVGAFVAGPIALLTDDVEVAVELHVDLASVAERDLDLVVALRGPERSAPGSVRLQDAEPRLKGC
jgi:hypothetical protein